MCPDFDFDRLAGLARTDPAAFEAQRLALFEGALAEMPPGRQGAARVALAEVQVRMAGARNPAERLAVAMAALADAVGLLQREVGLLSSEIGLCSRSRIDRAGAA